jgi:hypothetical protein
MLAPVATPREQMKVRAIIRPNMVSEIRCIGSSTRPEEVSEASGIVSNAQLAQFGGGDLLTIFSRKTSLLVQHRREAPHQVWSNPDPIFGVGPNKSRTL